jgi:hypothetical protein
MAIAALVLHRNELCRDVPGPDQVHRSKNRGLLGGLPNLHNPRHSDCKGRTATGLTLDGDVTAHHLTEASAYNEAEAGPSCIC